MKIVKSSKRVAHPHPDVTELIKKLTETATDDLAALIAPIQEWTWPRSDLGNWVKVLNKFDAILKDIIRDYDVDKLQLTPFPPNVKATVLEILRLTRMLLENSTGRKLYASYDRLNSLLFSSDVDVVLADLKVILRPSQQYSSQPPPTQTSNISSARLLSLSQTWSVLRNQGIELHDLLDPAQPSSRETVTKLDGDVQYQFYRKPDAKEQTQGTAEMTEPVPTLPSSSSAPASPVIQVAVASGPEQPTGLVQVHLIGVGSSEEDPMRILADAIEKYSIPDDEKFELLCRIRVARALASGDLDELNKLAAARLFAISIYTHTHGESQALGTVFLYEPDLVNHISELMNPERDLSAGVLVATLTALDAIGRYRSRIAEVLGAVNAGVSHGPLLSLLRKVVSQLETDEATFPSEVAEALLTLLMLLATSPGGGTMIVGAGLVPLIIQILDIKPSCRLSVLSRTTVLLDSVLYGYGNGFQIFCNSGGVDALVNRIAYEIDIDISEHESHPPVADSVFGGLSQPRSSVLKHLLRSMHRMMQASGAAEGLRTLVDSSLPSSLKKIIAKHALFGSSIFSIAINLMSLFVHNEPTSLTILQEAKLPDTFYDAIENGIEPALEVISVIPNAIGALCLNAVGEAELGNRPKVIPAIFATFTSESHIKVMGEKENAIVVGQALDELVRHHPTLKPQILDGLKTMLQRIEDLGNSWSPSPGDEGTYLLQCPTATKGEITGSAMMDVDTTTESVAPPSESLTVPKASDDVNEEIPEKPQTNSIISFIDIAAKLLEGFFQYPPHCRDFITKSEGIERLGRLLRSPALPIRFAESAAVESFVQLFRIMAELQPKDVLPEVLELTRTALEDSKPFWQTPSAGSMLVDFADVNSTNVDALNVRFHSLVRLQNVLVVLGEIFQGMAYSHPRNVHTILQPLATAAPNIIEDLGLVHRAFLWENILLKNAELKTTNKDATTAMDGSTMTASGSSRLPQSPAMVVVDLPKPSEGPDAPKEATSSKTPNSSATAYVVTQIPFSLTPFFQAIAKLFTYNRRSTELSSREVSSGLARRLASVLLLHCQWETSGDHQSSFAFKTLVISFITIMLRDERNAQGHVHTLLLLMFYRRHGIEAVIESGSRAASFIQASTTTTEASRPQEQQSTLPYAYGLLNVVLHLLNIVVSTRPLLESSQTPPLITPKKDANSPNYFEPHDYLVRVRLLCFPFLRDLWESSWLSGSPLPAIKSVLGAVVETMSASGEEALPEPQGNPTQPAHSLSAQQRQPQAPPDEASITQLADMGFSRQSAERALARARNNVNTAAELLLSHPHLFYVPNPHIQANAEAAEPEQPAAPVDPQMDVDMAPAPADLQNEEVVVGENPDVEGIEALALSADSGVPEEQQDTNDGPIISFADIKAQLDEARTAIRDQVVVRALQLLDHQQALVFEVKSAFLRLDKLKDTGGLGFIMALDDKPKDDSVLAARCRLLALILHDPAFPSTNMATSEIKVVLGTVVKNLRLLPSDMQTSTWTIPRWLGSHLLAAEGLLSLGDGISEVVVPADEEEIKATPVLNEDSLENDRAFVFDVCVRLLNTKNLPRDEMLAVLRLLVLMTKRRPLSVAFAEREAIPSLLSHLCTSTSDAVAYRTLALMIMRHVLEDETALEAVMQHQLTRHLSQSRNRLIDSVALTRGTASLALRDPDLYVAACKRMCRLNNVRGSSTSYNITAIAETESLSPAGVVSTDENAVGSSSQQMQVDDGQKLTQSKAIPERLIHFLMAEILRVGKQLLSDSDSTSEQGQTGGETATPVDESAAKAQVEVNLTYAYVLMQTLSELLSSYDASKISFISFHKRKSSSSSSKEAPPRHRPSLMTFLLTEIVAPVSQLSEEASKRRTALHGWAASIIIGLCSDVFSSNAAKEVSEALTTTRRFALDAIAKVIKDASSPQAFDARWRRISNLADLVCRLVSFQSPSGNGREEVNIQIAKTMLEKNYASLLTNALNGVDLNHPGLKTAIASVMRPLEYLTKVAIKMGRASSQAKVVSMQTDDGSSDEEGEESDREETPDLYRNSSLGMFRSEIDNVDYGNEEDEEMGEDEDEDEDEMDYVDDDSSGTSPSNSDEAGIGPDGLEVDVDASGGDLWANEPGQAPDENDDDENDEDDGAEDDIVWDGQGGDTTNLQAEDGQGEPSDDGESSVSGDEAIGDDPPSDEEFVLEFSDPTIGEEPGWVAPSAWVGIPPPDGAGHRHAQLFSQRRRSRLADALGGAGSSRRGQTGDVASHPLLTDQADAGAPDDLSGNMTSNHRRASHEGMIATGSTYVDLLQTISNLIGAEGAQVLQQLITHGRATVNEDLQIPIDATNILTSLGRGLQQPPPHFHHHMHSHRADRRPRQEQTDGAQFTPQTTAQRWAEEVKLLNPSLASESLTRLANHVTIALLPAAREAARIAEQELERLDAERKVAEEQRRLEQEQIDNAVIQETAPVAPEDSNAGQRLSSIELPAEESVDTLMMEEREVVSEPEHAVESAPRVETESEVNDQSTEGGAPSNSQARVTILVHGNPVDITDTGIDVEFLEALPDDMREEIINQHTRESHSTSHVEAPVDSQISPEFLEALPPDIRAEILRQEAADQARRERAQAAAASSAGGPSDIDAASFLASLDPALRQTVLMEQDEGFLQTLPSNLLAEANVNPTTARRSSHAHPQPTSSSRPDPTPPTTAPKEAVQLLDRTAVAALVRLLFTPQSHKRTSIHKVLINICENSKSRLEILQLLIAIMETGLQESSTVEKGAPSGGSRKSKNTATARTAPRKILSDLVQPPVDTPTDTIPNLTTQRCLEALTTLVSANELCSRFFLSEHPMSSSLRHAPTRKGKGKEKSVPQTYYPIVLILELLDKPTILRTPSLLDLVASLLSSITRPLVSITSPAAVDAPGTSLVVGLPLPPITPLASASDIPEGQLGSAQPVATVAALEEPVLPTSDVNKELATQVPSTALKLVVNILTIGDCSSRTFQQTLSLIQHLSHLPDARDIIASELRSRAQTLGQTLSGDLQELVHAVQSCPTSDSLSGEVVRKFSPASSDQAKLLRVLKTIDYMFSSRSMPSEDQRENGSPDREKAQAIYEAFRFTTLWEKLSECLTSVSEKRDADHLATILMPLIESLMVVCKYVSGVGSSSRIAREAMSPRSPQSPRTGHESTEDLFVSFTDAHRKVLNSMVRNNPSLMSGSFSLLVNNPRVLDFDNKRNYFTQKLRRRPASREQYGTLQVNVRRQRVFDDSFHHLQGLSGERIKYGKLSIRFFEEEGVDAGGVTREWFQILARQMFNVNYALFQPCAADKLTYQPNQSSWVNPEHLSFFKFVGRIIGKAIFDSRLLDAYFARSLYRQMLGKPVDYRDVEWVDPEYYKSLVWILENDPAVLDLTFSVESNAFGLTKVVPLKEGGHTILVTNENKREYVQLSAEYRLVKSIKEQIDAFLTGFYDIVPRDLIAIFNEQELELLISGTPDIDVDEWRAATDYTGYTSADPVIVWWWRALKSFNRDERAKVLSFATGTSKVPLGGFTELQGVQGVQRFSIHKAYGDHDRLPQAHTCFNQIDLPQYTSYEKLRTQVLMAINEGGEGFGFA